MDAREWLHTYLLWSPEFYKTSAAGRLGGSLTRARLAAVIAELAAGREDCFEIPQVDTAFRLLVAQAEVSLQIAALVELGFLVKLERKGSGECRVGAKWHYALALPASLEKRENLFANAAFDKAERSPSWRALMREHLARWADKTTFDDTDD